MFKSVLRSILLAFVIVCACLGRASAIQVVFSEVMYNPAPGKPEYVEVSNITITPLDMAKWSFVNGISFTFPDFVQATPQAHFLRAFERIIVSSADAATTRAAYPTIPANVRIFGPYAGALDNAGETVTLHDKNGVVLATLSYRDEGKWPVTPDGTGHSLVLADENGSHDDWRIWRASRNNGGSPGVADPAPLAAGIALNEVSFRSADGRVEWVEIRNNGTTAQDTTGLFVASALDFTNKVALSGTINPGAVASLDVDFPTSNDGDVRIYIVDATNNVRDVVKLRRQTGRSSWQVFPAGSREWYSQLTGSRDAQNTPARNTDIVINEIMLDPPSNERDGEFIELYNRGAAAVDLSGWTLDDGVDFVFPAGTSIAPGGYLVVAANAAWMNANYPGLAAIGNWSGNLSNGGERVRLEDQNDNLVDEVDYRTGGEWPELAGGNGSSLELVNPAADNSVGTAWRDSDESTKSTFQTFTIAPTNPYRRVSSGGVNDDEIRVWLPGEGHMIMKDPVLRPTTGSGNLFVNGNVTTLANNNVNGWQSRGTHWASFDDSEGVHIVAQGSGDNKVNHAEKDAAGMAANVAYTMTFQARWVYGMPRVVVQSWDMSWGGTVLLPIPANLGTPGAQNSRFKATPPPQVTGLRHSPAVPTTSSTVTVTARVASATPLTSVQLLHRLDNATYTGDFTITQMVDTGASGDTVAGDGIYTGQIPLSAFGYNVNGRVVEFYVQANASNGESAQIPRSAAIAEPLASFHPRRGLFVVDSQSVAADHRRVRVVISNYWLDALSTPNPGVSNGTGTATSGGASFKFNYKFPRFNSYNFPCVFIHNESEPYYGAGVHKTGSPFTRTDSNSLDRGRLSLTDDRPFRGKKNMYWDNDSMGSGGSGFHNRIHRYYLYLLGVPANENEVLRVTRNNAGFNIRESNEVFDKDMLDRINENGSDGLFYEIDDKFWIGDDGYTRLGNSDIGWDYDPGNSPGADNPVSYHNNMVPKSREVEYDFGTYIEWCKQLEQGGAALGQTQLERMADVKAMAAYAAVRGYSADWDNITMTRAKNGFFFNRATDRRWMLIHWDSDNTFQQNRITDAVIGNRTNVPTFYDRPYVRRYLNYYLAQMIGPLAANGARINAWIGAEEASSNSFSVPFNYASWPTTTAGDGFTTRHSVIQAFIGSTSLNSPFAITSHTQNATVTADTIDVAGRAPVSAFSIVCVNQPDATLVFGATGTADVTPWALRGIRLRSGLNSLVFRMLNHNGIQVGADLTLNLNKTTNALPVISFVSNPGSENVGVGELLVADASQSFDPEGTPLSYLWSVSPSTGYSVSAPTAASRNIVFSVPGNYTVTVQATDGDGNVASTTRTYSVFDASDFENFNGGLKGAFTIENVELRDNYSPDAWYSFSETEGRLVLQITDRATLPLRVTTPTFPLITRAVPSTADFLIQTDLTLEGRQYGPFSTGLYLSTIDAGVSTRYVLALESGNLFRVYRAIGTNGYSALTSTSYQDGPIILRIVRVGSTLLFQRKNAGEWTNITTASITPTTTMLGGGIFGATGTTNGATVTPGQSMRVAFDYLLVSDPAKTGNLAGSLRITEIMYNPAGPGGVEFIELRNMGTSAINLNGVYFEDAAPFSSRFTFGDLTLQPGQYCVVTDNTAGFIAKYGSGITIAGQYTGGISNDGEPILLKDASGNTIHDFTFDDVPPWPVAADGGGPSMEVIVPDPSLYGNGTNWRASLEIGGSPGAAGLGSDSDGDGASDAYEIAFGSDPNDASSHPAATTTSRDATTGNFTITWPSQSGRSYAVKYRDQLESGSWETLATVVATGAVSTYTDTTANTQPNRFYRIETALP
jgi:hypothetical protein